MASSIAVARPGGTDITATPRVEPLAAPACPWQAFLRLRDLPGAFFLDSAAESNGLGVFSFLGAEPLLTVSATDRAYSIRWRGGEAEHGAANPFRLLRRLLAAFALPPVPDMPFPFAGGAVGYLGYDLKQFVERLPRSAERDTALPDLQLAFYDTVIAFTPGGEAIGLSRDHPACPPHAAAGGAAARLERLAERLRARAAPPPGDFRCGRPASSFTPSGYRAAVRRAKEYIAAGDIFQANISQRFRAPFEGDPLGFYGRLRGLNPAPFAAFLRTESGALCSASPERFLRVRGERVETRPIKGTRRRGGSLREDRRLSQELLASAKDNAELAMIIDLERNDLGRVCLYGSVSVPDAVRLESYPDVFHLVGTVEGRLHPRYDRVDLLKAAFPGGSITGAPKIRAMEIIDELEPTARGVYTGAIGYIGFDGDLDLNIAIRTAVIHRGQVDIQVGGGIVADSDPGAEYDETLHKGRGLFRAVREAGVRP
jgi:para-aminobenzoate synthetase component 1